MPKVKARKRENIMTNNIENLKIMQYLDKKILRAIALSKTNKNYILLLEKKTTDKRKKY